MSRQKNTQKSEKVAQRLKHRSKMKPKWSSGARFSDFLETLFSYKTTLVLLVFTGSGWSRGAPKSTKKRVAKKTHQKHTFLSKNYQKLLKKGLGFRSFLAPFSYFLRFRRPRVPKGAPRPPRDSQSAQKGTKKTPKGIKMEPKVLENAKKNTKRNSRWVYKKPTTNLKQWMPKSMKGGTVAEFRVSVTGYYT